MSGATVTAILGALTLTCGPLGAPTEPRVMGDEEYPLRVLTTADLRKSQTTVRSRSEERV